MPDWMRDVLIALGAFVGGRAVNAAAAQMQEGRELRRGVDRLTTAVEGLGGDIREVKSEIHEQVSQLRQELHGAVQRQDQQFAMVEDRLASTNERIDVLAASAATFVGPVLSPRARARMRLNQEMGCVEPVSVDPKEGA